jgi:ribosome-binding factor A
MTVVKAVDRSRRVGELVHRALATIVRDRLWDQDFKLLSITAIDMARDLKKATVFVSVLGQADEKDRVVTTLNDQAGFLRRELSKKINLRHTPEINFRYDSSIEQGYRLNRLIDGLAVDDRTDPAADE